MNNSQATGSGLKWTQRPTQLDVVSEVPKEEAATYQSYTCSISQGISVITVHVRNSCIFVIHLEYLLPSGIFT